jgi:arylsulfatase A-like enzyme
MLLKNRKTFILIITVAILISLFFIYKFVLHKEPSLSYDFIRQFGSAYKINFDIGDLIDKNIPKVEQIEKPENLNDFFTENKTDQNKIIDKGIRTDRFTGRQKDGYFELVFLHKEGQENNFLIKIRKTDENNFLAIRVETDYYVRVKVYKREEGKETILSDVSTRLLRGSYNGLEIVFVNDFLSVGINKITLFQDKNKTISNYEGELSCDYSGSVSRNETMEAYFVPIAGSLKEKLTKIIRSSNINMFRLNFFDKEFTNWNGLDPESELTTIEKPHKALRRVRLDDETLPSIYFMCGSMVRYDIEKMPDDASLEFSLATPSKKIADLSRYEFTITVRDTKNIDKILKKSYNLADIKNADWKFIPFKVNLEDFSGHECKITFSMMSLDGRITTVDSKVMAVLGAPAIYSKRKSGEKNVILISLDTLNADHMSCYGYHRKTSPVMDKFAADYTMFKTTISSAPFTLPSHMSMLTSLYPNETGYIQYVQAKDQLAVSRIAKNVKTLAQYMSEASYKTAAFTGGGMLLSVFGFDKGFQYYYDKFKPVHTADVMVDQAIGWLKQNEQHKFFLFLHTYEIHQPYIRDYFARQLKKNERSEKELTIAKYDSGIHYTDEQLGRLFEYLKKEGLFENTLIIITSDHGENFRTPIRDSKPVAYGHHGETLYDCELKVPLLIGGVDDFTGGKVCNQQVRSVDIMPTILEYLGIAHKKDIRGLSALHLMLGSVEKPRGAYSEAVMFHAYPGFDPRAIRTPDYKYIYNMPLERYHGERAHIETDMLFDLKKDPEEKNNLATIEYKIHDRLREQLVRIIKSIKQNEERLIRPLLGDIGGKRDLEEHLRNLGYIQ